MAELQVGDMAPDFSLPTQTGDILSLSDLKGGKTVLYFYPKDNTSVKSHQNFCSKHDLNFTLLADTEKTLCEAFGVWVEKSMYGRRYMGVARKTFLLDEQGYITHIFDKVRTADHYNQIINELNK